MKTIIFEGKSSFVQKVKNKLKSLKKPNFKAPSLYLTVALSFKYVEEPKVSIIIPVFNKSSYTYQCLKSIIGNTPQDLYEIIVVDNA